MKKQEAIMGLVNAARVFDTTGLDRRAAQVSLVAWCGRARTAKVTEDELGKFLGAAGVTTKKAQAAKYGLVGTLVAREIDGGADALELADHTKRLTAACNALVRDLGKGAREAIVKAIKDCETVEEGAIILESMIPAVDEGAKLLEMAHKALLAYVEGNHVPTADQHDMLVEMQANLGIIVGRC